MLTFKMPDVRKHSCGKDGIGFPEFVFDIRTNDAYGCHRGVSSFEFTLMKDNTEAQLFSIAPPNTSEPLVFQYSPEQEGDGGIDWGVYLKCTECGIRGRADTHVLTRVDNYNPVAEMWAYGDLALQANIDLEARAWLNYSQDWEEEVLNVTCKEPVCITSTFAGIEGAKLGLMFQYSIDARVAFDAAAEFRYKTRVRAEGTISLHTGTFIASNCA